MPTQLDLAAFDASNALFLSALNSLLHKHIPDGLADADLASLNSLIVALNSRWDKAVAAVLVEQLTKTTEEGAPFLLSLPAQKRKEGI